MPVINTPISPVEGGEMFQRLKTQSLLSARTSTVRPLSDTTDMFDTEFEDSDFEQDEVSPKHSFDSDDSRRKSQTTLSSFEEAPTPDSSSGRSLRQFDLQIKPVEGPRGPHLFRSSQGSAQIEFDYGLQMSPLLPTEMPTRNGTAFSDETVTPIAYQPEQDLSIDAILSKPAGQTANPDIVRAWSPRQVVDHFFRVGADESILECLELNDVDGDLLLDLEFDDLSHELGISSFGKRHMVWDEIARLRGDAPSFSPQPTPFEDTSRPCTTNTNRRSPSRSRQTPIDGDVDPFTPGAGKKRRGRKAPKNLDIISPQESVSIVAIEQLIPKPHKCNKGVRCAKYRKQQRELQQMHDENALGRFPISPTKGGRIHVTGDPGNATTAQNIVPNVHMAAPEDPFRPASNVIPSMVASSDLLGPGQLPEFALNADMLDQLDKRDAQDNVRQFLTFQHMQSVESPPTPPPELAEPGSIPRSESVPLFPAQHHQAYPGFQPQRSHTTGPRDNLKALPRLEIPRSQTAAPQLKGAATPDVLTATCRSSSPEDIYRLGTPASEMDVPLTAIPTGPVARDASQSVPPNMQFRQQVALGRSQSTRNAAQDWRRPSMALPALREGEVLDSQSKHSRPSLSSHNSSDSHSSLRKPAARDPSHHSPTQQNFGYGPDCTHAGWMKKRKTKMLRHEWQETHCRLKGTELAMHTDAKFHSKKNDTINVDDYAVACSTVASTNKLSAAMKAFHIKNAEAAKREADATAFAFQLVPSKDGDKKAAINGKTHHFAVKTKDERIDWMRELMLAKALQQKGKGYDVEVNGVQA